MKNLISAIFVISVVISSSAALGKGQLTPGIKKHRQCSDQAMDAARRLSAQFINVDRNSDGQLTQSEIANLDVRKACFRHLDRNHDGLLSTAELARFA